MSSHPRGEPQVAYGGQASLFEHSHCFVLSRKAWKGTEDTTRRDRYSRCCLHARLLHKAVLETLQHVR